MSQTIVKMMVTFFAKRSFGFESSKLLEFFVSSHGSYSGGRWRGRRVAAPLRPRFDLAALCACAFSFLPRFRVLLMPTDFWIRFLNEFAVWTGSRVLFCDLKR